MKPINLITSVMVILFIFTSCKKDDSSPQQIKLSKADYGSLGIYNYTYDANGNMLTEAYSGNASNPANVTTFSNYDSKGRVTEYTTDYTSSTITDLKFTISHNADGKIERSVLFTIPSGAYSGYSAMEYQPGKAIEKDYGPTNNLFRTAEYILTADGNNVAEIKTYNSTGVLVNTLTLSDYDDKKSIGNLFPIGYQLQPVSKNNFRARTSTAPGGTGNTSTQAYEYNAEGYPVSRTFSTSGTVQTFEFIKL